MFNSLKLDGNCQNILTADNGLTFCIKIGDEASYEQDNILDSSKPDATEPTISVLEKDIEDEKEFVSHEIADGDTVNETRQRPVDSPVVENMTHETSCMDLHTNLVSPNNGLLKLSEVDKSEKMKSDMYRTNNPCTLDIKETDAQFNIKKRVMKNKRHYKKNLLQNKSEISSVVMKNMANYKGSNYSGIRMMVDPVSGECILQNSFYKINPVNSLSKAMKDKPKVLENSNDKLFILNKNKTGGVNKGFSAEIELSENLNSESFNIPTIQLVKEKTETEESPVSHESKFIISEEGNINSIKNPIGLSEKLKKMYVKNSNDADPLCLDIFEFLPEAGVSPAESRVVPTSGCAPGVNVVLSWEAVKERIEELQEMTMTKFIFDYKTPSFNDDPKPFKRVHFELHTKRRGTEVIIPKNGIPFIFLGTCLYSCHLGKSKWKHKEHADENCNDDDSEKPLKTKKIGCPATLSIARIARFPDFDIRDLSPQCENAALKELKDAWDFATSRVRYYIEYHLREPQASDHKGHEVNSSRFKEPVDPRILEKVRHLTRQGYFGAKFIHQKVEKFVREELFKGKDPPLDRRRYNPSRRDIRYAIYKAKEELKKERKSLIQLQCSALAREISSAVRNITNEEYLNQLNNYLTVLWKTVKSQDPLERYFLFGNVDPNKSPCNQASPGKPQKRQKTDDSLVGTPVSSEKVFLPCDNLQDGVIEQFYINVPETGDSVFNSQIYTPEFVDMNPALVEPLQPHGVDNTVTEVYYYYPDGTCELATTEGLANVQT